MIGSFNFNRSHLSPKRAIALLSAILTCYSAARVGVLFFEAIAIVREERGQDAELLELCQRGDARGSNKMREACLKARADRASPLLAKAIVYAVSTAFKDFTDTVGSPFKFAVVLLFIISSVALPILPWARALFGTKQEIGLAAGETPPNHFIVFAPSKQRKRSGLLRRKLGKHIPMLRGPPTIDEYDDCDEYHDLEPAETGSSSSTSAWRDIPFGGYNSGSDTHSKDD